MRTTLTRDSAKTIVKLMVRRLMLGLLFDTAGIISYCQTLKILLKSTGIKELQSAWSRGKKRKLSWTYIVNGLMNV